MYRRSKFNEVLLEIRESMSAEAEFDVAQFVAPLLAKNEASELVAVEDSADDSHRLALPNSPTLL